MLPALQNQALVNILSDETAKFEDSQKRFMSTFNKNEYFRAGWVVQHMIQHNMLNLRQRLVGLYILYETYRNENMKTTPFYPLVLDLLVKAETLHAAEQKMLIEFLKSVPKSAKQTPNEYIRDAEKSPPQKFQQDLEPYRKAHCENMPKTTALQAASVVTVLRDEDDPKKIEWVQQHSSGINPQLLESEELQLSEFLPDMVRPLPPEDDSYLIEEAEYLVPGIQSEVLWDYRIWNTAVDYKELAFAACKGTLKPIDEKKLIEGLRLDPELALECELKPDKIPILIQNNNVELVLELLLSLNNHKVLSDYYNELFNMPQSTPLVNLVLRLKDKVEVPLPYFEILILNGIEACMSAKEKEKGEGNGKIKKNPAGNNPKILSGLISKMMTKDSHFLNNITDDLRTKIQRFSIEFCGISEVMQLNRAIGTVPSKGSSTPKE